MRRYLIALCSIAALLGTGCAGPVAPYSGAPYSDAQPAARESGILNRYAERVLYRFKSSPGAASPEAGLVRDASGNLFGTTVSGGTHQGCPGGYDTGCGTVYELDTTGKERLVYSFAGNPDASEPFAPLLLRHGVFYGTTAVGGGVYACYAYGGDGCGTIFKIDAQGKESLLYQFQGDFGTGKTDGQDPHGPLVDDSAGNLYGSTPYGGADNYGTIFRVTKSGAETVLYSFTGGTDGGRPYSGVVRDAAGNLYGAAYNGGGAGCVGGCGTIFELTPSGSLTTLYTFKGKYDGGNPYGGLAIDAAGNLYGTAQDYGDTTCVKRGGNPGCGTVFRISAARAFKVLHVFYGTPDGATPSESLTVDKQGNVYGTTSFGGNANCNGGYACGIVFEISAAGTESILHTFTGGKRDGEVPYGSVTRDARGNLYGTTVSGGIGPCSQGCGIVFKLSPRSSGG